MSRLALLAVLVLCSFAPPVTSQAVHAVRSDGSGAFTSVQAAVDAAAPGDVLLVTGGFIETVVVDKGLLLVAAPSASLMKPSGAGELPALLHVRDLPADQAVVVAGFTLFVGDGGLLADVLVTGSAGPVWLQDCFVDSYGAAALVADGSPSVVVTSSSLQTNLVPALPDGTPQPAPGALVTGGARLYGYDAELRGSHGTLQGAGNPVPAAPADGGAGLAVVDAVARLSGGTATGGSGQSLLVDGCLHAGDGGAGVLTADGPAPGTPAVLLQDVVVQAGGGGFSDTSCAPPSTPGPLFDVVPGSLATLSAPARSLSLPSLATQGGQIAVQLAGQPGDLAFLIVSARAAPAATVNQMDLHVDFGALLLLQLVPLPSGPLSLPAGVPPLPPGLDAFTLWLQAIFVDGASVHHTGNPRALVID